MEYTTIIQGAVAFVAELLSTAPFSYFTGLVILGFVVSLFRSLMPR